MSMKPGADFSRGCALPVIVRSFLVTHPHPAVREWVYASAPCPGVLAATNLYSPLRYLVPSAQSGDIFGNG